MYFLWECYYESLTSLLFGSDVFFLWATIFYATVCRILCSLVSSRFQAVFFKVIFKSTRFINWVMLLPPPKFNIMRLRTFRIWANWIYYLHLSIVFKLFFITISIYFVDWILILLKSQYESIHTSDQQADILLFFVSKILIQTKYFFGL